MKIGIASDAHCNVAALQTAVDQMAPVVDEILFAGDAVYEYRMSNEIVDLIRTSGMHYVLGNHEIELLSPGGIRAREADGVRQDALDFLTALPYRVDLHIAGKHLVMVHGSPFPPYNDYVTRGSMALRRCGDVEADILVIGHTHVPLAERVNGTLVVNPGSIGESREHGFKDLVSYAILDTSTDEVEFVKFANPRLAGATP
jgi:putative phosphoesterase